MLGLHSVICYFSLQTFLLQSPPVPVYAGSVWTQLLTALVIGLLTAFAFQFLVTNLGIAIGISILGMRSAQRDQDFNDSADTFEASQDLQTTAEPEQKSSHFSTMAGLGILFTVNSVLFTACFLAAKFSQITSPIAGAITGVVIWSAYFLLLLWVSSTAVSSLVGSVLGATTEGVRRLVATIATALSPSDTETVTQEQMIAAIREEMQTALDTVNLRRQVEEQMQAVLESQLAQWQPAAALNAAPDSLDSFEQHAIELKQALQTYLLDTDSSKLTPKRIDRNLQKLLQQTQTTTNNHKGLLKKLDRSEITQWLNQREDLTDKKRNRIVRQIEETWEQYLQEQYQEQDQEQELQEKYLPANYLRQHSSTLDYSDSHSASEEQSESESPGLPQRLSQITTLLLDAASDTNLPNLLQQLQTNVPDWTEIAPVVLPAVLTKIRDSINSDESGDSGDASDVDRSSAPHTAILKQNLEYLLKSSPSVVGGLSHALVKPIERLHDRSLQQIETIQQAAQNRIEQVKQQTQQQLENTRRAAATAAWWLFFTAATAAVSSALAGALSTGFRVAWF